MPKSEFPLSKHTLNFFSGDIDWLQERYPGVGSSVIIRKIVRAFILKTKQRAAEKKDANLEKDLVS